MELLKPRSRASIASLALLATGLAACREIRQPWAALPEYCRYTREGPLCASYDPTRIPYPVALGLHPLTVLAPADLPRIAGHFASLKPRPRLAHVLAPMGPVPEDRRPYDPKVPQPLNERGDSRLVLIAVEPPDASGRVDVHSVILAEDRVVASRRVAAGLDRERLRGSTRNGRYAWGFSLADSPGSRGDLFLLRWPQPDPSGWTVEGWAQAIGWQRIGAESRERKLDWFRSITNPGTCAGAIVDDRMMLAPVPQSWFAEYADACPTHPEDPKFQKGRRRAA